MFWKNSKPKSSSTKFDRADENTTIKTTLASSESTSSSITNSTVIYNHGKSVKYSTTRQTVVHQQHAGITEINRRYEPSPEELTELLKLQIPQTVSTKSSSLGNKSKTFGENPSSSTLNYESQSTSKSQQQFRPVNVKQESLIRNTGNYISSRVDAVNFDENPLSISCIPFNLYLPSSSLTTTTSTLPKYQSPNIICSTWSAPQPSPSSIKSLLTETRQPQTVSKSMTSGAKTSICSSNITPSAAPPKTFVPVSKKSKLQPGIAYIFNNEKFDNADKEYRIGSSQDVKLLRETFEGYKMKVKLIENATVDKIRSVVRQIETKNFANVSCIVIVILSHGGRLEVIAAKDDIYSMDDEILFPILRNRTLINKPKMLFVQACKGIMEIGSVYTDSSQQNGSPDEILKCCSTFEGYVAYRTDKGSLFIQTFCNFLKLFGKTENIKNIMELVTKRVKQDSQNKQIPAITSTLTQPYVFGDYI